MKRMYAEVQLLHSNLMLQTNPTVKPHTISALFQTA